jgi:carboxymethylenebutenolidase
MRNSALVLGGLLVAAGCGTSEGEAAPEAAVAATEISTAAVGLPAGAQEVQARLAASPRHGEWVTVRTSPTDSVRAWVVYPERSTPAPVIVVVHEIFGLSHWVRGVADQFAAEGFIAIAPDLLTMNNIPLGADGAPDADIARAQIANLNTDVVHQQILAVAEYGMALPAAQKKYGIVGYCWGGDGLLRARPPLAVARGLGRLLRHQPGHRPVRVDQRADPRSLW